MCDWRRFKYIKQQFKQKIIKQTLVLYNYIMCIYMRQQIQKTKILMSNLPHKELVETWNETKFSSTLHAFINHHQSKLIDSKCKFLAKPEAHMLATSCLIFFGPQTRTPTSDPLQSNSIPAFACNKINLCFLVFKKSKKRLRPKNERIELTLEIRPSTIMYFCRLHKRLLRQTLKLSIWRA